MKRLKMKTSLYKGSLFLLGASALALSSCANDASQGTATLDVSDQVISQNKITVTSAEFSQDGWIVIHDDAGGAPVVPGIISVPTQVQGGSAVNNIEVPFTTSDQITDGQQVWVMCHKDTVTLGTYEFDGQSGKDDPFIVDGNIVMKSIQISAASISVNDQPVTNNTITIDEVVAATDGWIVVHNDDGTGNITLPGIIGKTAISAGSNTNVVIELDSSITYTAGQKLFPMVHIDAGVQGTYEFPGADLPEVFGNAPSPNNIILTAITVQ